MVWLSFLLPFFLLALIFVLQYTLLLREGFKTVPSPQCSIAHKRGKRNAPKKRDEGGTKWKYSQGMAVTRAPFSRETKRIHLISEIYCFAKKIASAPDFRRPLLPHTPVCCGLWQTSNFSEFCQGGDLVAVCVLPKGFFYEGTA